MQSALFSHDHRTMPFRFVMTDDHDPKSSRSDTSGSPLTDALDSGVIALGSAFATLRAGALDQWQRHGRPLAIAAREKVFGATVDPRTELSKERFVRISEAHLRRLLIEKLEESRRVISGELHLEQNAVHLQLVLRRWRPVHAEVRFTAIFGNQDEESLELGIRRLGPTQLSSPHRIMRLLLWVHAALAKRRGEDDPLDHLLLRRLGSRREGDLIYVRMPREPLTAAAGQSRVLRWLAAYATFTSLTFRPGSLKVGFNLGRLTERIADLAVLRHLLAAADEEDEAGPLP